MKVENEECVLSTQTITLMHQVLSRNFVMMINIDIYLSCVRSSLSLLCVNGDGIIPLTNVSVSLLSIYSWLKIRNFKIALAETKCSMFNFFLARNVICFAYKESQKSSSIFYSDIFHKS